MPRLRCPRCSTIVTVDAGTAPVCPACGFGATASAPAHATAPAAAPAALAAPLAAAPAGPTDWAPQAAVMAQGVRAPEARRGRGPLVAAIAIAGILVLGGLGAGAWFLLGSSSGEAADLTEAEAQQRLAASLEAAGEALSGGDARDDLKQVRMTMDSSPGASVEDLFSMGDMQMTIDYGRDDVVRLELDMRSGPATVQLTAICTPRQQFLLYGGEAYGSRPSLEPSGESCQEGFGMAEPDDRSEDGFEDGSEEDPFDDGEAVDDGFPFPSLEELEAEGAEIAIHRDGSITAVVDDGESLVTAELDARGRMQRMTMEGRGASAGMDGHVDFVYGTRSAIALPDDYDLMPATVETEAATDGATTTWTVTGSPQEPPLADFEVRIQDWMHDPGSTDAQAAFRLVAGEQRNANFTFRFTDADDDGKLSAGDSYVLTDLEKAAEAAEDPEAQEPADPDDQYTFEFDIDFPTYTAVLFDVKAGGAVNSGPEAFLPLPPWLALGGLALALGVLVRRRSA